MIDFNNKFEGQIDKHVNDNAYTDRKISGTVVGAGVFGAIGFVVFYGTLIIPISGSKD